jgi:hypothetical protein
MPLKKLVLKPGVSRENTRYSTEGGWYECDKIRFRQATPEKIGGWHRYSDSTFLGTCRKLWTWSTLGSVNYVGVGTHLKFYVAYSGDYFDITPIRSSGVIGNNPFATTSGLPTVVVTHTAHGAITNDFVTFSGATTVAGLDLNHEYQITFISANSYSITASGNANATTTGGGAAVNAAYQVNTGDEINLPLSGWGAGPWGGGTWGIGQPSTTELRMWSAQNFGEDLVYGPDGGGLYYWDASVGTGTRGVAVTGMGGASDVPIIHDELLISDASRFVICLGVNDYGSSTLDPMLIRWSDQESVVNWTPAPTNQAGSLRLSHGSRIVASQQVRQEILVWTDVALYSMQYLGPPAVWGTTLLTDNITIMTDRSPILAAGITYWMGLGKFYVYDGTVRTLDCDLRQYIFSDFNYDQKDQVFSGSNERFNEVWWFYCSSSSNIIDRYVIYNYVEKGWYYGTINRTAWLDETGIFTYPIAATNNKLLFHEFGVDDNENTITQPIYSYILSSELDIDDGHNFAFIWRMLPDVNFTGSTVGNPAVTMSLFPMNGAGSGYTTPASVAGSASQPVVRGASVPVEAFTNQVNIRVRGRQMVMKIESSAIGTQWQLGYPRIDIRPDGRKS